jgi:hypothetical protein
MQESVLPPTEIEPTWADFTAYSPGSNSLDLDRNPEEWEKNGYLSFIYQTWPLHGYKLQYDYVQSQKPLSDESLSRLLTIDEILSLNLPNTTLHLHHMVKNVSKKVLQVGTIAPKEDENWENIPYSQYDLIFKNVDQVLLAQPTPFRILQRLPLEKLVAVNITDLTLAEMMIFFYAAKQLRSLTVSFPDLERVPLVMFHHVPKTLYELTIHGNVAYYATDVITAIQSVRCLRLEKFSSHFDSVFWEDVKNVYRRLTVNNNNNIVQRQFSKAIATSCQYLNVLDLCRTNILNDDLLTVLITNKVALRVLRADYPVPLKSFGEESAVGFSFCGFRDYLTEEGNYKLEMLTCRGHLRLTEDVFIIKNIASIRRLRVLDLRDTACTVGVNARNLRKLNRDSPGGDKPEVLHIFVSDVIVGEKVQYRPTACVYVHYGSNEDIPTVLLLKYKESVPKIKQTRPFRARNTSDSEQSGRSSRRFSPAYARSRLTDFTRSVASTGFDAVQATINRLRSQLAIQSPTVARRSGPAAIVDQYHDQPTTSQALHRSRAKEDKAAITVRNRAQTRGVDERDQEKEQTRVTVEESHLEREVEEKALITVRDRPQTSGIDQSAQEIKQRRLAIEEARLEVEKERLTVEKEMSKTLHEVFYCVRERPDVLFKPFAR